MEELTLAQAAEEVVKQLANYGVVISYPVLNDEGFITEQARQQLGDFAWSIIGLAHKLAQNGYRSSREIQKLANKMLTAMPVREVMTVNVFDSQQLIRDQAPNHWASRNREVSNRRPIDPNNQFPRPWRRNPVARGPNRYSGTNQ